MLGGFWGVSRCRDRVWKIFYISLSALSKIVPIYTHPNNCWKGINDKPRKYFPLMKEIQDKQNNSLKNEKEFPETFQLQTKDLFFMHTLFW